MTERGEDERSQRDDIEWQRPSDATTADSSGSAGIAGGDRGTDEHDDQSFEETSYGQPSYGGTQSYGQPDYPQPSYGQPSYGGTQSFEQPSYGTPDYSPSAYGSSEYGSAEYDQPHYPQPEYGTHSFGHPDYGSQPTQTFPGAGYDQSTYGTQSFGRPGYDQPGYDQPYNQTYGQQYGSPYAQPYAPPGLAQQPPKKTHTGLWISLVAAVVVIAAAVAVLFATGLITGDKRLSHTAVEDTIAKQTGATDVTCNGGNNFTMTKNDARFTCTAAGNKRFTVTVTNKNNGEYTYEGQS